MPKDHFVPACYLKGFSENYPANLDIKKRNKVKLYAYDKVEDKVFPSNINNLCNSTEFYTIKYPDGTINRTLDDFFKETENSISQFIYDYYNHFFIEKRYNDLPFGLNNEKEFFARYLLNQIKRTPKQIEWVEQTIGHKLKPDMTTDERKAYYLEILSSAGEGILGDGFSSMIDIFMQKNWSLLLIEDNKRFISSDHPVFLMEEKGFALDKTEICFPLNEKMAILLHKWREKKPLILISKKRNLNKKFVRQINFRTALNAHRFFYASDKAMVISIVKTIKNKDKFAKKYNLLKV